MKNLLILCCIAALTFFGCKKGDTGAAGANGTNGNANVQSFTFLNQIWINSGSDIYISEPAITQAVLDKGAVDVYWRDTGDITWITIPNPFTSVVMGVGYIDIYPANGWGITHMDVKIVVIPAP